MQPVENEKVFISASTNRNPYYNQVAIHDEQPQQVDSKDVFLAQHTADIDDSSDDEADAVDDDDDDPDIVEWFDGLGQSSTGNYHPFPSKIFALLFFLVNSHIQWYVSLQ